MKPAESFGLREEDYLIPSRICFRSFAPWKRRINAWRDGIDE